MTNTTADRYWLLWSILTFFTFIIPETISLHRHRPGGTLSETIWRLEGFTGHTTRTIEYWTIGHYWFAAIYVSLFIWLGFHFILGWWR